MTSLPVALAVNCESSPSLVPPPTTMQPGVDTAADLLDLVFGHTVFERQALVNAADNFAAADRDVLAGLAAQFADAAGHVTRSPETFVVRINQAGKGTAGQGFAFEGRHNWGFRPHVSIAGAIPESTTSP